MESHMSKFAIGGAVVMMAILGWSESASRSQSGKLQAQFPGACLKWVHAAESDFESKHLDLNHYTISILEQKDSVIVSLSSSDAVENARGSTGSFPGYMVEISKKDSRIIRSNYIR
jgi:hypothetical protein